MGDFKIFKVCILLIVICLLVFSCQAASDSSSKTAYYIELKEDGSAIWITEEMIVLNTAEDILAWEDYHESFEQNKDGHIGEYKLKINEIISKYGNETKRAMFADDFGIDLSLNETIMGTYGVIRYRFIWHGFGIVKEDKISIGDVFSGVFLSKDDVLIISIPENCELNDIKPEPDDIRYNDIIWYGHRSFYDKEPAFEVKVKNNSPWAFAPVIFIAAAFLVYLTFRNKKEKEKSTETGIKSDKDVIKDILQKMGGEAFQSDLVSKTGFSKSKMSNLINELNEEGAVMKIRKGNKNMIRLNK